MNRFNSPRTLKSKIIIYFLLITVVPSVITSYFYYRVSQNNLEKSMRETSISDLVYSMDIIDRQLINAGQLSDWIFMNRNLDDILTRRTINRYSPEIKSFLDLIDYQLRFNTAVSNYVSSFIIVGKNGLDLRAGPPEGSLIDIGRVEKTDWFQKGLDQHGLKSWYGVVANPATINYDAYILPLVRPVLHSFTNREIGWHMIGFKTALISDLFKNLEIRRDESLLVLDSRGFCIYHNDPKYIGRDLSNLDYIRTIVKRNREGYIKSRINGVNRLVAYARSSQTGWSIIRVLSEAELSRQKRMLFNISLVILLSSLFFTSLLTFYLSTNLTNPLTKISRKTKAIAAGDFAPDPAIEGRDELGTLGRAINEMASNIKGLLDRLIADEQEKRRMEIDLLQHQVNPHFLYNTLNSLKLMATIQGADGIKDMVSALGRLMMNLSKNTSEKIPLAEEFALLNDYVYIQNIRYKGKIKLEYHLEDEACQKNKIIKFTLQPIVENAIFHGIEPKKDAGTIKIAVRAAEDHLNVSVTDDGVGISPEQIEAVLTKPPEGKTRGLSGIGIKNVAERLKLVYGPEYGLTIESKVGEYTRVELKIPREL
ncbi:MAG TPA: sensor histidine kinase [Bacillota bacterium]